jgi:hypothetical protein
MGYSLGQALLIFDINIYHFLELGNGKLVGETKDAFV